ncbi:MAG: anhydro-N-acetylmuramic acid kinase [Bacteroidales bacterium]|nr:anhydro-N-acetylmuramic acid kinase [Bacteroidales bacterium]
MIAQRYIAAGLMSGTSVDGLDIAICLFEYKNCNWSFEILYANSFVYPHSLRQKLISISDYSANEIIVVEKKFSEFAAASVNNVTKQSKIKPDIIASHGHTVFHKPKENYTYQIGNGEIIAKLTGIPVVCDFRRGDVALGGQGAPLVPIGDKLLFSNYPACLNLGGFSNISYNNKLGKRIAYDISPVNIVFNKFARQLNMEFDNAGEIAKSGVLIRELFHKLNNLEYYQQNYPKSLSIEWVKQNVNPILNQFQKKNTADLMHTFSIHIAHILVKELNKHTSVLITGGGAYNKFLINNIRALSSCKIQIPDNKIIDFKEALIFAFLGVLRIRSEVNILSSVTGAKRDSCCGVICNP